MVVGSNPTAGASPFRSTSQTLASAMTTDPRVDAYLAGLPDGAARPAPGAARAGRGARPRGRSRRSATPCRPSSSATSSCCRTPAGSGTAASTRSTTSCSQRYADALAGYGRTKGSLHFSAGRSRCRTRLARRLRPARVRRRGRRAGRRAHDHRAGCDRAASRGPYPSRHDRGSWDEAYQHNRAPWDIGRPQPAIARLADAGELDGAGPRHRLRLR